MKNKSKPIFIAQEYPAVFLYLAAISLSLMYVISRSHIVVCTVVMTALSIGVFMLFYALRRHKGFAALAALALGFACMTLLYMGQYPHGGNTIMDYIFTASSFFDPFFAVISIAVFSVIVGFACSYFLVYSPRPCFLMLPSFIPLILSARTAGGLPEGMLIFMLAGFAATAAVMAHPEFPAENIYIKDKRSARERIGAVLTAGAVLAGLLVVIPRSDETPQGEYLDNVFSETGGYYAASERLTNFLMSSSVNTGGNSPQGNLLFIAKADAPMTVVRWAFDEYYGSDGWRTSREFDTGYADWQSTANHSSAELVYRLKNAAEAGRLEEYAELLDSVPYSVNFISGQYIKDAEDVLSADMGVLIQDGSQTSVIIHPNDTFRLNVQWYSGRSFRTMRDEIFTESNLRSNASYSMSYFADLPNEEFIKAVEKIDFGQLIADAAEENVITNSAASAFIDERDFAERYREVTYAKGMTENIEQLAAEITAGLDSDYDKALAIERWFGESGFVYDMDFVPALVNAEYFIFDSKTGICSDFATAATLIARAAGLTARYTEGFNLSEEVLEDDGLFHVTDAQAHAVSSIYLDGYGWMTIDPTRYVPVVSSEESGNGLILFCVIAAGIIAVIVIIFRRQLSELLFTAAFPLRKPKSRIRGVYLRTRALAASISGINPESTAVGEVRDIITRTLSLPEQANRICGAADELLYGSGEAADTKGLLRCYKQIKKMKRRMRK